MLRWIGPFVFLLTACGIALAGTEERPGRLRILYAGNPGSDRERDYVGFLKGTFAQVDAVDYRAFREEMAEGHDVVIFDWTSIYPRDAAGRMVDLASNNGEMNYPKPTPHLSEGYSRPTVLIGGPGQRVVRPLRLKIDWGCLCLNDHAHGMKAAHPIFREPFPVDLRLEEVPTPAEYKQTYDGKPVGPTIQAWRIQTPRFYDADPGLVSRGDEFEESPDAEAISSGINSKTPEMVALGRQGNYFLWGFASPPSEMTPEARKCFLNVVCYIRQFDGRKPMVRKPEDGIVTRKLVHRMAGFAKIVLDPDGLRKSYPAYASYDAKKYESIRNMELRVLRKFFPAAVNDQGTSDPDAYLAWIKANDLWLVPGAYDQDDGIRAIAIDEDLKALGMGNRDIKTLDACVSLMAGGEGSGRALRVLKRYTSQNFTDAEGWKAWLNTNRNRLVFTEVGGYRFVTADSADVTRPEDARRLPLSPPGPPKKLFEPVKFSGSVEPSRASSGQVVTVSFRLDIAPRWHIAAKAGTVGSEVPLYLRLALPAGLEPDGEWTLPEPTFDAEGHGRYEGTVELIRRVRITAAAAQGKAEIAPSAYYQACDQLSCRPAMLKAVAIPFEVVSP
jgi:hypothetical protein